jgi:glutaredoxin 3
VAAVVIYGTRLCSYCRLADQFFERKGISFEKVMVDDEPHRRQEMVGRTGKTSVPQIVIKGTPVGGYMDLIELDRQGKLEALISA